MPEDARLHLNPGVAELARKWCPRLFERGRLVQRQLGSVPTGLDRRRTPSAIRRSEQLDPVAHDPVDARSSANARADELATRCFRVFPEGTVPHANRFVRLADAESWPGRVPQRESDSCANKAFPTTRARLHGCAPTARTCLTGGARAFRLVRTTAASPCARNTTGRGRTRGRCALPQAAGQERSVPHPTLPAPVLSHGTCSSQVRTKISRCSSRPHPSPAAPATSSDS